MPDTSTKEHRVALFLRDRRPKEVAASFLEVWAQARAHKRPLLLAES